MKSLLFGLLVGMVIATSVWGVDLVGQPEVNATDREAVVSWQTDVTCGTRLSYGLAADRLDLKQEGGVVSHHQVKLTQLQPGTTYHFSLGSARQRLYRGSFTTSPLAAQPKEEKPTEAPSKKTSVFDKVWGLFSSEKKGEVEVPASSVQPRAPPTDKTWGRMETLQDHFLRHGGDFGSRSADAYAAEAWHFLQEARKGRMLMKWDEEERTLRVYDPGTRGFAAYNHRGLTKTYFRPDNPSYWHRQPGQAISPDKLPF